MSTEQTRQITKGKYRPEIDGLRAFAVVAVIINHFNKSILPGGYLGVDIFFVISGYVITSSLYGRPSKDFKDFISGFYERRIKRLVPALSVFVLITSIAICLFNPEPGLSLRTGLTSLFGLSNFYLLKQSTDYFAQSTELNVFTHTWSLGVEEQFYILFPFLIWFSGFGRQTKNGARNLFLAVGALTIASLVGFLYLYPMNQSAAYFLMPTRFWEMAAGCLIFIGFQKRASIEQFLERVPPLLVLGLIVGVMYLPMSLAAASTIAVVALSSILIASLKKQTAAFNIFTHPKMVYIGLISYSLYLWHWGVLSISRWTIGIHWWSVPFQVALMLSLAIASYRWIETPSRKGSWHKNRWINLISGGGIVLLVAGSLVGMQVQIQGRKTSDRIFEFANGGTKHIKVFAKAWHDDYFRSSQEIKRIISCHMSRPVSENDLKRCTSPNKIFYNRIVIVGDSHAVNYSFGFQEAFPGRVSLFTVGHECGYLPKDEAINTSIINCSDYVSMIDSFVETLREGDILVLGNDWQSTSRKRKSKKIESAIRKLAINVTKKGGIFILLDDVPDVGDPLNSLKTWYRPFGPRELSKKQVDRDQSKLDEIGFLLTKDIPGAYYLSLRDGLCNAQICSIYIGGKVAFFDKGHITISASRALSEKIISFFAEKKLHPNYY
jgi:peptidoglycan/LPS O-acetylase OafA/YrhL